MQSDPWSRLGNARAADLLIRTTLVALVAGLLVPQSAFGQAVKNSSGLLVGRTEVRALARLLPESGLVVVGVRPGQRIERIEVKAGEKVAAGATLAILEGHEAAKTQLSLAEAQRKKAREERDRRREQLALQREAYDEESRLKLDGLTKQVEAEKKALDQVTAARAASAITGTLGLARTADQEYVYNLLKAEYEKDQALLRGLNQELRFLSKRRALEDNELADSNATWEVLDQQISLARSQLDQTIVRAPSAAEVLEIMAHPGEISSGPLLYLGDLTSIVAKAEVDQRDLPTLTTGDPADVLVFDRALPAEVTRIGRLVAPGQMTSLDPTARVDRRVVSVTLRLKEPALASSIINMQVEVAIKPTRARPK